MKPGAEFARRRGLAPIALVAILMSALICCGQLHAATPDPGNCADAANDHHAAQASFKVALNAYATCVSEYFGRNDCSTDFQKLVAAQRHFSAASALRSILCAQ